MHFKYCQCNKGLNIDSGEQYVYFVGFNVIEVVRLLATDGSFFDIARHSNIGGGQDSTRVHLFPDNSGYAIVGKYMALNPSFTSYICKYLFSDPTNDYCQNVPNIFVTGYGQLLLSNTALFILGPSDAPTAGFMYFYKIQFGAASVDWSYVLSATGGSNTFYCESLLSADTTMIYSFFVFGTSPTAKLFFFTFMAADGSISGTRYQLFSGCGGVYGAVLNGNYIFVLSQISSSAYMVIVNTATNAISVYGAGSRLYGITVESSTGMYTVVGQSGSSGFKTNFKLDTIGLNFPFNKQSLNIISLAAGNYDISTYTASISAVAPISVGSKAFTNSPTIAITSTTTNSNILMPTSALSYSFSPTQSGSFTINIPCVSVGMTTVVYSISNYGAETAPSWISINSSTGVLTISSASIAANQVFSFYVNSVFNMPSSTVQTVVSLTSDCVIQNCLLSTSSTSNCIVCGTGYSLTSGNCGLSSAAAGGSTSSNSGTSNSSNPTSSSSSSASNILFILKTTLQSLFVLTICIVYIMNTISDTSYASIWSLVGQVQLFFLLLITRAFIPDDPTQVINGFDFTLNFPSFIPYDKISGIKSNFNKFNFSQSTPILESNNVHSDSTLQNLKSYLLTTFLIVILALCIFCFSKKCRGRVVNGRCTFVKKLLSKLVIKMNETLLFGYFIRSFLEMIQFSAISSIHEVLKFDASEVFSLISLIVALCYITTLIIIFGIMIYLALSSYIVEENEPNKLGDFFEGMKMKRSFKFYAPMMIARRVIFVLLLVSLNSISSKTLIGILSFLQLLYMIYVAYLRPYSEIKCNIIDIMNEVYFLLLLFTLIFLNEERDWNNVKSSTYMWTIASSSMVTFCIVLVDSIIRCIFKKKKKQRLNQVQVQNMFQANRFRLAVNNTLKLREETKKQIISSNINDVSIENFMYQYRVKN